MRLRISTKKDQTSFFFEILLGTWKINTKNIIRKSTYWYAFYIDMHWSYFDTRSEPVVVSNGFSNECYLGDAVNQYDWRLKSTRQSKIELKASIWKPFWVPLHWYWFSTTVFLVTKWSNLLPTFNDYHVFVTKQCQQHRWPYQ